MDVYSIILLSIVAAAILLFVTERIRARYVNKKMIDALISEHLREPDDYVH